MEEMPDADREAVVALIAKRAQDMVKQAVSDIDNISFQTKEKLAVMIEDYKKLALQDLPEDIIGILARGGVIRVKEVVNQAVDLMFIPELDTTFDNEYRSVDNRIRLPPGKYRATLIVEKIQ